MVHKKTVLHLAEVSLNRIIFHKRSQLYLALKKKINKLPRCEVGGALGR